MTSFQERVFKVVRKIPRGKVLSYKEVAKLAGSPRAFRAVGNALNKNRNRKIPCHRVVRSDSMVGGYAHGTKKKTRVLKKEGLKIRNFKICE
jgi:O-6-methylguanine DNA methyltransferase